MKKILQYALNVSLITCLVTSGTFTSRVSAAVDKVYIEDKNNTITIGNDFISRTFTKTEGSILTSSINNKRIGMDTKPQAGSEDFLINLIGEANEPSEPVDKIENNPEYELVGMKLDASNWSASLTNGVGVAFANSDIAKLFDNNPATYINDYEKAGHPFTLHMDLEEEQSVSAMAVQKRPGYSDAAYGTNGTMGGYEIYTSMDDSNWTLAASGEFTAEDYNLHQVGDLYNVGDAVYVNFEPVNAKYIKVLQTSVAFGKAEEFSSSEVAFYSDHIEKKQIVKEPELALDRSAWIANLTNASDKAFTQEQIQKLFDGDKNTFVDDYRTSGLPFTLDIDLGSEQTIRSLSVDKRPGYKEAAYGKNGTMGGFTLYVSDDGETWKKAGQGAFTEAAYELHQEGDLYNVGNRVYANFQQPYTTRFVRLVQTSTAIGSAQEFSSAEIQLYEDAYKGPNWNTPITEEDVMDRILSSELEYNEYRVKDTKEGKKLTISYEPIEKSDVTYDIDQVIVLDGDAHYMRSFIEIKASDTEKARIDYIDTDRFVLPQDAQGVWSHPDDSEISSMWIGQHELMLGQPIYVNGLFMGSEFPAADTIVDDNTTQIRYYSGKTFDRMRQDNQLTKDDKFVSWQNVVGVAEGIDSRVVQTSFFDYIEQIATPTEFRKQYNSWYDNMMNISDESIATSFLGAEAGLSKEGIEPLDSYVVDDGWNNYYDGKYTSTPGSAQGTTPNQTGFWEFNAKFPNELYTSSSLSNKLNSTFGLWVGPQGGYNYFPTFGEFIEASGTGYMQNDYWKNVCVGSDKYVKNFEKRFIDYQTRFNIDYWKWDGFAVRPCTNASHDHMTGGYKNMYFTSDLWEKWTDLFENTRAARAKEGKGLWINATCYVNLSPWMLQWVNTVWIQDSGDTGQAGTGERHEQKIYYRDNVYYNLYKTNQIQFPLKNIYNHDPIYGVSDGSTATTDVFREYLFANAVRGTAFWELYFSPSIMDEAKWKVTADALEFAESNFDILKNAKMFGNVPTKGVYGYSSWLGEQGIVSFTNPLDTEQSYTLTIDDTAGAVKSLKDAAGMMIYPYATGTLEQTLSYGDELTVTLAPHETKIMQYNKTDNDAPAIVSANNTDNRTVRLKFSERINSDGVFKLNGQEVQAQILDDYRSVELKSEAVIPAGTTAIEIEGVHDALGNAYDGGTISFTSYNNGVIADLSKLDTFVVDPSTGNDYIPLDGKEMKLSEKGMQGDGAFAISFMLNTTSNKASIVKQGDDIDVSIDADGYLHAKLGSQEITSKEVVTSVVEKAHGIFNTEAYVPTTTKEATKGKINDGKNHTIVISREVNNLLKLYIDGTLAASVYDEDGNDNMHAASVVLGSTSLTGKIANLEMVNHEIDYAKAAQLAEDANGVEVNKPIDRSTWTATACSEMPGMSGDAQAMAAIDGNLASWWHTNYAGGDTHTGNHWIELDFHGSETMDEIQYTGRGGSNGDVEKYNLYAKQNGEWTKIISEGTFDSSKTVNTIAFDEALTAEGLRFELLKTVGGFGAAKEIEAFQHDTEVDRSYVEAIYQELKAVYDATDKMAYTPDSYAVYHKAYNKFANYYEMVKNGEKTTKFVADKIAAEVVTGYDQLVEATQTPNAAKEMLASAINKAEKANLEHVAPSVVAMLHNRLAEAKLVYNDANATTEDYLNAWLNLANALHYLDFTADKTQLGELIAECEAIDLDSYTSGVEEFEAALAHARNVYNDDNVLQKSIDEAYKALETARDGLMKDDVDKALLQRLYTTITEAVGDGSKYNQTNETWIIFMTKLENAMAILQKADATQVEVNTAFSELANAYTDIRLLPNEALLADLQSFITLVEETDLTQFSDDKVMFINDTKTKALDMLAMPEAITPTDSEQIQKDMEKVRDILLKGTVETPDTPDTKAPSVSNVEETKAPSTSYVNGTTKQGTTKTGDTSNILAISALVLGSAAIMFGSNRRKRKVK